MKKWLLIIVILVHTLNLYACKCRLNSVKEDAANSDQIFSGKVIKKTVSEKVSYHFMVTEMFKGEKTDTIIITTNKDFLACGMEFNIGKEYLVYSFHKNTSRCNRNAFVKDNKDIKKLRRLSAKFYSFDKSGKVHEGGLPPLVLFRRFRCSADAADAGVITCIS
jgi:hypothetical protein